MPFTISINQYPIDRVSKISVINKLRQYLRGREYYIGFVDDFSVTTPFDYNSVKWLDLDGYKDGWFADPFIYEVNDKEIIVFAEEWYYPIDRGRLVKLLVDRQNYKLIRVEELMRKETHLSFPYVISDEDQLYICPENYQGGSCCLYKYDDRMGVGDAVQLVNEPLLDSQIVKIEGSYYLFATKFHNFDLESTRHIYIYKASQLEGPYDLFQEIEEEAEYGRGAGSFFYDEMGRLIRPTQNCSDGEYGREVILMNTIFDTKSKQFTEEIIGRISPVKSKKNGLVLHTLNVKDNLAVIDGNDFISGKLGRLLNFLIPPRTT